MSQAANTLTVAVDERVTARVPDYVLGLVALPAIEVTATDEGVAALLTAAEDELHRAHLGKAEVSALPTIAAWREAYRAVGVNPNRFPCAAESVLRRVAKGDRLPRINALVDLCNAVSLRTKLPVASCDVSDITGALVVRPAEGTETYRPLGAPQSLEHPEPGEIIYADAVGRAHSRRWNWRQSDEMRTDLGARRLVITIEAAHPGGRVAVSEALDEVTHALEGTLAQRTVLDRSLSAAVLFLPDRSGAHRPGAALTL